VRVEAAVSRSGQHGEWTATQRRGRIATEMSASWNHKEARNGGHVASEEQRALRQLRFDTDSLLATHGHRDKDRVQEDVSEAVHLGVTACRLPNVVKGTEVSLVALFVGLTIEERRFGPEDGWLYRGDGDRSGVDTLTFSWRAELGEA